MKLVYGPIEKTETKAIQLEVVLQEEEDKKVERPKAGTQPRGSPRKKEIAEENISYKFSEKVELCCLTMTAGPGTSFGEYRIPEGANCSLCGSALIKGRK